MMEQILKSKNHTARIDENFEAELQEIKEARKDQGLDQNLNGKFISTRILTRLIVKHCNWKEIKKDLIELDLGVDDEQ